MNVAALPVPGVATGVTSEALRLPGAPGPIFSRMPDGGDQADADVAFIDPNDRRTAQYRGGFRPQVQSASIPVSWTAQRRLCVLSLGAPFLLVAIDSFRSR